MIPKLFIYGAMDKAPELGCDVEGSILVAGYIL